MATSRRGRIKAVQPLPRPPRATFISLLALAAVIGAGAYLPAQRLWGVNHLAFYPVAVRVIAFTLIVVAFIPPIGRYMYGALIQAIRSLASMRRVQLLIVGMAALSIVGFVALRSSTLLLGDGQLIAKTFEAPADSDAAVRSLGSMVRHRSTEVGAIALYHTAAGVAAGVAGLSPVDGVRAVNCLLGAGLVLVLLWIVLRGPIPAHVRVWLAFLVLTSGAMELYFGYVESYAPLVFLGALYLASSFRVVRTDGKPWAPVVLAVMAAVVHVQGILLLPSLALLLAWRFAGDARGRVLRYLAVALAASTVLATVAAATVTPLSRYFLPAFGDGTIRGWLSPAHWLDILNQLLLIMPALPVLVVLGFLAWRGTHGESKGQTAGGSHEGSWMDVGVLWQFATLVLIPCLLFLALFRPEIGMARDWDLFSMVALGLVPLAVLTVNRLVRSRCQWLSTIAAPALVMSGVLCAAWVGINASPVMTAERFERILDNDRSGAGYGYEALSRHYMTLGLIPQALAAQDKAATISGNPRLLFNLSVLYKKHGDMHNSNRVLREILQRRPEYTNARHNLALQLVGQGDFREAAAVARGGIELDPDYFIYRYVYGKCLVELGLTDEGATELRRARQLGGPPPLLNAIDELLESLPPTPSN